MTSTNSNLHQGEVQIITDISPHLYHQNDDGYLYIDLTRSSTCVIRVLESELAKDVLVRDAKISRFIELLANRMARRLLELSEGLDPAKKWSVEGDDEDSQ